MKMIQKEAIKIKKNQKAIPKVIIKKKKQQKQMTLNYQLKNIIVFVRVLVKG